MGNILPILISYNLHKEHIQAQQQRRPPRKEEELLLLKKEKRFYRKKINTNNM